MFWSRKRLSSNGKVYSAIDVGTTKVCTLMGILEDGDYFHIVGVGITRSRGMRKATVVSVDEIAETIRESVREAEISSGLPLGPAFIGVTGGHISCFNTSSTLVMPAPDHQLGERERGQLMSRLRHIRLSPERELIHALPRLHEQEACLEKDSLPSFRLQADVHVVTAAAGAVRNLTQSVRRAGVVPEDVVLEPLASGEAVLRSAEKDVGVVVVDIGGGTTDIALFKNDAVWHTAAIPVAGNQVTQDLAVGLGIPFEVAEELKVKYASLKPTPPPTELPPGLGNSQNLLHPRLQEIVYTRLEEMMKLVWVELSEYDLAAVAPAGIVLTGGSSKIPGLAEMVGHIFGLPCRVGVPRNIGGLVDHLHDPAFATSVGLLYWGARHAPLELIQHHRPSPLTHLWLKVKGRLFWRWGRG